MSLYEYPLLVCQCKAKPLSTISRIKYPRDSIWLSRFIQSHFLGGLAGGGGGGAGGALNGSRGVRRSGRGAGSGFGGCGFGGDGLGIRGSLFILVFQKVHILVHINVPRSKRPIKNNTKAMKFAISVTVLHIFLSVTSSPSSRLLPFLPRLSFCL